MNYPLISEYIEAIKAAKENFDELKNLRPVLDDDGEPMMTSGNFAVVFKMKDEETGKCYALKCFTKEQQGRAEAYKQIAEELKDVDSPYLVSIRYLDKELFVDTDQTDKTEFPVLLMDWVEGKPMDKYLRENLDDKYALEMLAYRFSQLAQWLIPQPFAHGDLKPDNILVREDGTLVLVDYDGMYVPAMKGQKARELGSPDFRHPQRTENDFDEHVDDFPLVSILLSLKAISYNPLLLEKYGAADRLLLSVNDYLCINESKLLKELFPSSDSELNVLLCFYTIVFENKVLAGLPLHFIRVKKPMDNQEMDILITEWEYRNAPYEIVQTWSYQEFAEVFDNISLGYSYYPLKEDVENVCYFEKLGQEVIIVYNPSRLSLGQINKYKKFLRIELLVSGNYVLMSSIPREFNVEYLCTEAHTSYFFNCLIDDYGVKYSADKKHLLEGPIEETVKGSHTWKKGIINDSYNIMDGTLVICDKAFFNCKELISVKCPISLMAIGARAFQNCKQLREVHLNSKLLEICDEAFKNCKSLNSIFIPKSLSYIAKNAFDGSSLNAIYTCYGDKKRIRLMLPHHIDIIEELPF